MKFLLVIFLIPLLISCYHDIPVANIEFAKIEKHPKDEGYFYLFFSSDVELIENLSSPHTAPFLECFFKEDINETDFVEYSGNSMYLVGNFKEISRTGSKFSYQVETAFANSEDEILNDYTEIKELVDNAECLNCAVTAVSYMSVVERYISATMCIPNSDIQRLAE